MRLIAFLAAAFALQHTTQALLEEKIVSFTKENNTLDIARATIVADAEDFVGVHIALKSLVLDFEQITGNRPRLQNATTQFNASRVSQLSLGDADAHIIIGSVQSSLIKGLSAGGAFDVSDIEGKWEMFKTAIVKNPLPGVDKAFIVAGSDKRGTIYGIHTLAEQSGQSP